MLRQLGVGVIALSVLAASGAARQADVSPPDEAEAQPSPEAPMVARNEVRLRVLSFGVANRARPGDWAGVEVEIDDGATAPRNVMLRLAIEDNDGDTVLMERTIVSNPGTRQAAWLYLRVPMDAGRSRTFRVTAHQAQAVGEAERQEFVAGRMIGAMAYRPNAQAMVAENSGLIGVVGSRGAGLEQYTWARVPDRPHAVTGHELTEFAPGLTPGMLPDRWMGLSAMEALVWTGAGSQEQPGLLREAQAEAIREWVRRGGHLVVVLPAVAQGWVGAGAGANPLADIMPRVEARRSEGVDLSRYRSLLTADRRVRLPTDAVVHTLEIADGASPLETTPIMAGADGEVLAVRRTVGAGAVTVVGLDVASQRLTGVAGALQAEVFWNRLLGKRIVLIPPAELDARRKGQDPSGLKRDPPPTPQYVAEPVPADLDGFAGEAIANRGRTFAGLLLALIVFAAYWLLAGPMGYWLLKQRGWKQHAWVAFAAAGVAFTVLAWTGANLLKVRRVQGRHLTFVTSVYGQTFQTASVLASVFLPEYGQQRVSVAQSEWRNALAPWENFLGLGAGSTAISAFPDARGYSILATRPDTAAFPARATAKEIEARWAGTLPTGVSGLGGQRMIRPVAAEGEPSADVGAEIRIVDAPPGGGGGGGGGGGLRDWSIRGALVHDLPGALTRVHIGVVRRPAGSPGSVGLRGATAYVGSAVSLGSTPWKPGEVLVLDGLFSREARAGGAGGGSGGGGGAGAGGSGGGGGPEGAESLGALLARLVPSPGMMGVGGAGLGGGMTGGVADDRDAPLALSFFSQLPPPPEVVPGSGLGVGGGRTLARRNVLHNVDLSRWLNQPCVIVIGELEESALPVPISVDGVGEAELGSAAGAGAGGQGGGGDGGAGVRGRITGRTIVRWIYPLPGVPMVGAPLPPPAAAPGGGDVDPGTGPLPGE